MKTGAKRRVRHRASACVAMALAVTLPLALTACDDHSPVAAPTSTLPAQDPADDSSGETDKPSIPEYDTELDLNDEEKEAVEGALVAFEGYFRAVNAAYSGDFDAADEFPRFATGEALKSINGDVGVIRDGSYEFSGKIVTSDVTIDSVKSSKEAPEIDTVLVGFCFDLSSWSLAPKDASGSDTDFDFATMEHAISNESDSWKVSEQSMKAPEC